MLYAILGSDLPASAAARAAVRDRHLERVAALMEQGRLVLAGPFPAIDAADPGPHGHTGSLIVAEFPDLATAEAWAAADPYATDGVFASLVVRPFRQVLP
jgi:uncharacterized protein YciI